MLTVDRPLERALSAPLTRAESSRRVVQSEVPLAEV